MIDTLACNNCGAPLSVPDNANYVTCIYCRSNLAVRRTGSVSYTEVLGQISADTGQISANTGQMADDLRYIRLNYELQHLEREWQETLQRFETTERDVREASRRAADEDNGFLPAIALIAISGVLTAVSMVNGASGYLYVLWAAIFAWGLFEMKSAFDHSRRRKKAEEAGWDLELARKSAEEIFEKRQAELQEEIRQEAAGR